MTTDNEAPLNIADPPVVEKKHSIADIINGLVAMGRVLDEQDSEPRENFLVLPPPFKPRRSLKSRRWKKEFKKDYRNFRYVWCGRCNKQDWYWRKTDDK